MRNLSILFALAIGIALATLAADARAETVIEVEMETGRYFLAPCYGDRTVDYPSPTQAVFKCDQSEIWGGPVAYVISCPSPALFDFDWQPQLHRFECLWGSWSDTFLPVAGRMQPNEIRQE